MGLSRRRIKVLIAHIDSFKKSIFTFLAGILQSNIIYHFFLFLFKEKTESVKLFTKK